MRQIVDRIARVPKTCTWELTLRCNLHCGHCGSRAGLAREGEMPRERMLQAVGELAALGCERVTMSGGEPTMCEWWPDLASEGARLGVRMNMITNAVRVGRDFVRQAKDSGLCNFGVSLDGLEQEHDALRGRKGLYRNVMQLLDDCAAEKVSIGAITTVTKGNFRQLEELHDVIAGRVFVWQLQIGAAMGNMHDRQVQIQPEDLLEIVPALARIVQRGKVDVRIADNVGYYGPYEKILRASRKSPDKCWAGCYAGVRHIGIEADGGVKGCLSIQSSRATEGNLQKESLRDIWERPGAFAYNRSFQLDDLAGFCRTCVHAEVCRGGCLSMRSCEGGRDNPFCYHRVATLAAQATKRSKAKYVPMMVAPAALLAAVGCGGDVEDEGETVAYYGIPPAQDAGDAETGSDKDSADTPDTNVAYYGVPEDAPDDPPIAVDAYGIATDAPDDPPIAIDAYGIATDAAYGVDAPDDDANVDYYGMPDDAAADTAEWYGMQEPDKQ